MDTLVTADLTPSGWKTNFPFQRKTSNYKIVNPFLASPFLAVRPVIMGGHKDQVAAVGWMDGAASALPRNGDGGGDAGTPPPPPPPPPRREKRPKTYKSLISSKIQSCSTKLTDVKCWITKVNASVL